MTVPLKDPFSHFISYMQCPYIDISFTYTFHPRRKLIIDSLLVLSINFFDCHVRKNAGFVFCYFLISVIITLELNSQIIKLVSSGGKTADGIQDFFNVVLFMYKINIFKGLIPLMYMTQTAINSLSAHSSECLFTHFLRDFFQIYTPTEYFALAVGLAFWFCLIKSRKKTI